MIIESMFMGDKAAPMNILQKAMSWLDETKLKLLVGSLNSPLVHKDESLHGQLPIESVVDPLEVCHVQR